jgi:Yos1-like
MCVSSSSVNFFLIIEQAGLLILNRRRFLSKYGLDDLNHMQQQNQQQYGGGGSNVNPLKVQAVGLLHAVGYLKVRRVYAAAAAPGYHLVSVVH